MTSPEPRPNATVSRVQAAIRLVGLVIALTQGAVLPMLSFLLSRPVSISLPALALAGGMMGIAEAIKRDQKRKEPDS